MGIALLSEALVRRPFHYFATSSLLLPLFGSDLFNIVGPRFVEGLLFIQRLKETGRLVTALAWGLTVTISEAALAFAGYIHWSWQGFGLSFALHSLRFASLLGIDEAVGYAWRRQRLKAQLNARAFFRSLRLLWPVSWPVFGAGAALALKIARRVNRGS